ncbi:MAG TPA: type VI secretion system tube protein Hcp [Steroidobacteraceae bacterium]|nr:type VI secretion system tube protein Hcp [Steroidobacteraceae bacterium]
MAVDMFLTLENVKGETKDKEYKSKNAMDILAYSWGMSQSGTFHAGGGGGAGKANFQDISVTKWVDSASSVLMTFCAKGTHIPKGKLVVRKAGDKPLEYIIYELEQIMVTSVSTGGSGGEDRLTENVTFNFAKVKHVYWPQDEKGGKGPASVDFVFDIAANTAE